MSLLTVDQVALQTEVRQLTKMYKQEGHDLAYTLGFTAKHREEEDDYSYNKGTAVVYFVGNKKYDYEAWMCAQKGEYGLIAHVKHNTLTEALVDGLNRDC
jgi:hypothetical protein